MNPEPPPSDPPRPPDLLRRALALVVQERRRELGLTLNQAAGRTHIHPYLWHEMEEGGWLPGEPEFEVIGKALEADPGDIRMLALVSRTNRPGAEPPYDDHEDWGGYPEAPPAPDPPPQPKPKGKQRGPDDPIGPQLPDSDDFEFL